MNESVQKRKAAAQVIGDMIKAGKSQKHIAQSIAAYLVDSRTTQQLTALMRDVEKYLLAHSNHLEVTAFSAYPLSASAHSKIAALFPDKDIHIHNEIDPSVLGGVVVSAQDDYIDLSVRSQLQHLRLGINAS
jgi:F-type H+-transporting ATPase subunit delta